MAAPAIERKWHELSAEEIEVPATSLMVPSCLRPRAAPPPTRLRPPPPPWWRVWRAACAELRSWCLQLAVLPPTPHARRPKCLRSRSKAGTTDGSLRSV